MADPTMFDDLVTETRLPGHGDLDRWPVRDLVALMNREDRRVPEAVGAAVGALAAAIEGIVDRWRRGGRLVYVGAGTSGRLALLDAAECGPTFDVPPDRVVALVAGGSAAAVAAVEHAEDDDAAGAEDIRALGIAPDDAVVGVTASGRTPYVLGAVRAAAAGGALTVGVANNPDAALSRLVDHAVEVVTGPEVIAGSTRLKAGTAQKLVLNTISTVTMIAAGRTFGDLMVDVRATNHKLRRRAHRVVAEATGAGDDAVGAALAATGGAAKPAVVMLLAGVDAPTAEAALSRSGGAVRMALENLTGGAT